MGRETQLTLTALVLIFSIVLSGNALATRDVPGSGQNTEARHPDVLVTHEPVPTVLIPGMGRYVLPPRCKKPFPYNPITGSPIGGGPAKTQVLSTRGGGSSSRSQVAGGQNQNSAGDGKLVHGTKHVNHATGSGASVPQMPHP